MNQRNRPVERQLPCNAACYMRHAETLHSTKYTVARRFMDRPKDENLQGSTQQARQQT